MKYSDQLHNSVLSLAKAAVGLCGKVKQKRFWMVEGDQIPRSLQLTSNVSNLS